MLDSICVVLGFVGFVLAAGACLLIYKNLDAELSEIEIAQLMMVTAAAFGGLSAAFRSDHE